MRNHSGVRISPRQPIFIPVPIAKPMRVFIFDIKIKLEAEQGVKLSRPEPFLGCSSIGRTSDSESECLRFKPSHPSQFLWGHSSTVERWFLRPDVGGPTPSAPAKIFIRGVAQSGLGHKSGGLGISSSNLDTSTKFTECSSAWFRTLGSGPRGRESESPHSDQIFIRDVAQFG